MKITIFSLSLVLFFTYSAHGMSESGKIQYLLKQIEISNLEFVRNGTGHTSIKAREHLEYKLKRAGNRIKTAEDFIIRIAAGSSFSGKPYYIIKPDGTMVKSETWLREKLHELKKSLKPR